MLICVTPAELARQTRGGETVVHGYQCSLKSRASTTPGRALIFRKDLEHEGAEVAAGEKHVLALNLWAVRKNNSSQVLLVDFDGDDDVVVGDESRESALLAAAKQPAFAIPVDYLRNKFMNKCYKCGCVKPPRTHHCSTCDRCVLRMDHHCRWVANCVGLLNLKQFLLLVFYIAMVCLATILTFCFKGIECITTKSVCS